MRAIASACQPHTRDRRRIRWRLIDMVALNLVLWGGVFLFLKWVF